MAVTIYCRMTMMSRWRPHAYEFLLCVHMLRVWTYNSKIPLTRYYYDTKNLPLFFKSRLDLCNDNGVWWYFNIFSFSWCTHLDSFFGAVGCINIFKNMSNYLHGRSEKKIHVLTMTVKCFVSCCLFELNEHLKGDFV